MHRQHKVKGVGGAAQAPAERRVSAVVCGWRPGSYCAFAYLGAAGSRRAAWLVQPNAATKKLNYFGRIRVTRRRAGAGIAAAASLWSNDVANEATRNGPDETVSASVQYRVVEQDAWSSAAARNAFSAAC